MADNTGQVYSILPGLGLPALPDYSNLLHVPDLNLLLQAQSNNPSNSTSPWQQPFWQGIPAIVSDPKQYILDPLNNAVENAGGNVLGSAGNAVTQAVTGFSSVSSLITTIVGLLFIIGGLFLFGTSQVASSYLSNGKDLIV